MFDVVVVFTLGVVAGVVVGVLLLVLLKEL